MPHPSLFIPALAPSLNGDKGLMRMHHRTYARVRDAWVWMVREAMQETGYAFWLPGGGPVPAPCSVLIVRGYCGRPLDLDNLYAAAKVPLDAMRQAGVLPDDNPEIVYDLRCRQVPVKRRKDQHTTIILEWN